MSESLASLFPLGQPIVCVHKRTRFNSPEMRMIFRLLKESDLAELKENSFVWVYDERNPASRANAYYPTMITRLERFSGQRIAFEHSYSSGGITFLEPGRISHPYYMVDNLERLLALVREHHPRSLQVDPSIVPALI